ncbi:MAG: hypothetical protein ABIP29_03645, partial [Candidatus Eisenbacteria bacterium]
MTAGAQALLDRLVIELAARGPVPDGITRAAIRRRLATLLGAADVITPAARAAVRARLDAAPFAAPAPATGRPAARDDPPASFFAPWLGPRLKYSAALWSQGAADLAAAEEAMLALTCERARLA